MAVINNRGFSFIGVLAAIAASGALILVVSTLMGQTAQMQVSLGQKLEINVLKQEVLQALLNQSFCSCQLNPDYNTENGFPLTFDQAAANPTLELSALYSACDATNKPIIPIAVRDQELIGTLTRLRVTRIAFTNITNTGAGNPLEFQGRFQVEFDTGDKMSRLPMVVTQRVMVDSASPANARKISTCQITSAAATGPAVCTGSLVGGFCWFMGGLGRDCDFTCGRNLPVGMVYDLATRDYAGSNGNDANCQAVLNALPMSPLTFDTYSGSAPGVGCHFNQFGGGGAQSRDSAPTSSSASDPEVMRACACKLP